MTAGSPCHALPAVAALDRVASITPGCKRYPPTRTECTRAARPQRFARKARRDGRARRAARRFCYRLIGRVCFTRACFRCFFCGAQGSDACRCTTSDLSVNAPFPLPLPPRSYPALLMQPIGTFSACPPGWVSVFGARVSPAHQSEMFIVTSKRNIHKKISKKKRLIK